MRLSIGLAAGIAALALLAGCDLTGETNSAGPANQAATGGVAPGAPAPDLAAIVNPQRLKQLFGAFQINASSDVSGFDVTRPVEIRLPDAANVRKGRTYVFHAQAGPVTILAAPVQKIGGSARLTLERGRTAVLISDGRGAWLIGPV